MKNKKGFTLIELLVVVLIIGILAGVALPQYQKSVRRSKFAEVDLIINEIKDNIWAYLYAHPEFQNTPHGPEEDISFTGTNGVGEQFGECGKWDCETPLATYSAYNPTGENSVELDVTFKFINSKIVFIMDKNVMVWYAAAVKKNPPKELCKWLRDGNYPAGPEVLASCGKYHVDLIPYE